MLSDLTHSSSRSSSRWRCEKSAAYFFFAQHPSCVSCLLPVFTLSNFSFTVCIIFEEVDKERSPFPSPLNPRVIETRPDTYCFSLC